MKKFLEDSWVEYTSTIDKYLPNKIVAIRQHKYFKSIVIFTAFQLVAYAVVAMIGLNNIDSICEHMIKICAGFGRAETIQ